MACEVHGVGLCTAGCSKPPQESASAAEVTREHRAASLLATYPESHGGLGWDSERHWVNTGENGKVGYTPHLFLPRVAQAIADAEARGRASRDAELERVKAEFAELKRDLRKFVPSKRDPYRVPKL